MSPPSSNKSTSPWSHRWAVVLACATFPLLWVGGLVTTTDAGMAVPDWPGTYGYNLFLYPWQTWLAGPWDLLVEHGHRLLAATVGGLAIGLLVALWRSEPRRWVRWLGVAALGLVIGQGLLGGMRVLLDERTLALVHGCVGPLFFALAVSLAVVTSRAWREAAPAERGSKSQSIVLPLATIAPLLFYAQLVLGAVLRHVPVAADPGVFAVVVKFHLLLAALLVIHVLWLLWSVFRMDVPIRPLRTVTVLLAVLLAAQLALGAATWLVKYSVPYWASSWLSLEGFAVRADGPLQTHVVTAHVALGSLLLGTSVVLALRAARQLGASAPDVQFSNLALEGAR